MKKGMYHVNVQSLPTGRALSVPIVAKWGTHIVAARARLQSLKLGLTMPLEMALILWIPELLKAAGVVLPRLKLAKAMPGILAQLGD